MPRAQFDRTEKLETAMSLFWDKGYHATSLKDLEAALKMRPGSIYAAFTNKENLYSLTLERYLALSLASLHALTEGCASPLEALRQNLRFYAELPGDDRRRQACMLTRTVVDTAVTDPALAERARACLDRMSEEFCAIFQQAQKKGEIPAEADPMRLARRYQANLAALRLELHRGGDTASLRALAEDMAAEIAQPLPLPQTPM